MTVIAIDDITECHTNPTGGSPARCTIIMVINRDKTDAHKGKYLVDIIADCQIIPPKA